MFTTPDTDTAIRELDRRYNDGIDVTLLWDPRTNRVFVSVVDEREGRSFSLTVCAANALDAFRHPFAYATDGFADDELARAA